tara:strand:+ start:5690 stop:6094 length:405 start_codon:yes stop_codon:yes gene_type:complete
MIAACAASVLIPGSSNAQMPVVDAIRLLAVVSQSGPSLKLVVTNGIVLLNGALTIHRGTELSCLQAAYQSPTISSGGIICSPKKASFARADDLQPFALIAEQIIKPSGAPGDDVLSLPVGSALILTAIPIGAVK